MNETFSNPFGYATWALMLIPLVLIVRLLVKKSRWSILRMTFVALLGAVVGSLWLHMSEAAIGAESGSLGGTVGTSLAEKLNSWTGSTALSYFLSTALFFLWCLLAGLDGIIASSRFFINKPYVREVVKEKKPKPAKPKKPAPEKKPEPKKTPTPPVKKPVPESDDVPDFKTPALSLMKDRSGEQKNVPKSEIDRNVSIIRETLSDHHVALADITTVSGPTITLYKVFPDRGVKVSAVRNLAEDVSVALKAESVMASTLTDCVGFEVANHVRSMVSIRELLGSEEFRSSTAELPVVIGRKITGEVKVFDLTKAPHLLVAGATGTGKSVGLNVIIASFLYAKRPSELKMVFVDPKKTEFGGYSRLLNHYLAILPDAGSAAEEKARAIVKEPAAAEKTLRAVCKEMDERYSLLEAAGAPNIVEYLRKWNAHHLNPKEGHRFLPYLVVVLDEYAQLVLGQGSPEARSKGRSIMSSIISIAQMGRAAGIHLIIATQTPRKDVVSGMIKANFPMSIAFKTKTWQDSMVILDQAGAEKLIGNGDMLLSFNAKQERIQCGYISSEEISAMTKAIEAQKGYHKSFNTPYYLPEVQDDVNASGQGTLDFDHRDERFEDAARMVVMNQMGSTSDLQRKLQFGYARAGRVMDELEAAGIVGPKNGSKPRQVLIGSLDELETLLKSYK